jgi:hypothetical protein
MGDTVTFLGSIGVLSNHGIRGRHNTEMPIDVEGKSGKKLELSLINTSVPWCIYYFATNEICLKLLNESLNIRSSILPIQNKIGIQKFKNPRYRPLYFEFSLV